MSCPCSPYLLEELHRNVSTAKTTAWDPSVLPPHFKVKAPPVFVQRCVPASMHTVPVGLMSCSSCHLSLLFGVLLAIAQNALAPLGKHGYPAISTPGL